MHTPYIVDGGEGVPRGRVQPHAGGGEPRGLALLLHGWEGSESSYMRHDHGAAAGGGFATFRLNFRDHGDTHHLNPGAPFHSNRIDEVVRAAVTVADRYLIRPAGGRPAIARRQLRAALAPCA